MARWTAVAAVAALAAGAVVVGLVVARGGDPVRDARSQAAAYAESLLDRVPLPKGARPFTGSLPSELSQPPLQASIPYRLGRHRVYRVGAPQAMLVSDIKARGLQGFQVGADMGGGPVGAPFATSILVYRERHAPSGIVAADVQLSTSARSATESFLRVDALVQWQPERTDAERVPDADRVVTLYWAKSSATGSSPPERRQRVVDDPATAARLIKLFNALPTAPSEPTSKSLPPSCDTEVNAAISFSRTPQADADLTATSGRTCVSPNSPPWTFAVMTGSLSPGWPGPMALRLGTTFLPTLSDRDGSFLAAVTAAAQG